MKNVPYVPLLLATGLTCSSYSVLAEEFRPQESFQLEEVIVTAQKREQSLQDVPLSVAVINGDDLIARNENEIRSLGKISPGFTFADGSNNGQRTLLVRGVGTQTFSKGVEQSVSVVVDGVVATGMGAALLDMNDVSRVEILRGPQGMLFGKNASAGVLNVVTNNPTDDFEAMIGGSSADEKEIKGYGFVSGPLSDNVSGRLSFHSSTRDPIIDNQFEGGPEYNDRDQWGVRGKLAVNISENLDLMFSLSHAESDVLCCLSTVRAVEAGSLAESQGVPFGVEEDTALENDDSFIKSELDDYALEVNYDIGEFMLTSITGYAETFEHTSFRGFGSSLTVVDTNDIQAEIEQFSQEIRLTSPVSDSFEYQLGLYYFTKDLDSTTLQAFDAFGLGAPVPGPGAVLSTSLNEATVESESYALFGQGTLHLTEQARVTLGFRFNHEEVDMDVKVGTGFEFFPDALMLVPGATPGSVAASSSDDSISWRLIGEYDLTDSAMVYASVARGYKGVGANTQNAVVNSPSPIVDPEIPTNYEIGMKSHWLDDRVMLNATLFYTEFEDFQASLGEPGAIPPVRYLANAEKLETQGFELELNFQATRNLFLGASLAYVDARFSDYEGAPCYVLQTAAQGCVGGSQELSGETLSNSPEWSYSLNSRYELPLEQMPFNGFVSGSYYWQDEVQYQTTNNPKTIGDAYGVADLSIGIEGEDGQYQVQLFVKNLLDEFHETRISADGAILLGQTTNHLLGYDYTRRIGISGNVRF